MTSLRKGLKHQFPTYPNRATPFLLGLGFVTFYLPYLISYHVGPIPSFFNEVTAIGFSSLFLLFLYRSRLGSTVGTFFDSLLVFFIDLLFR